MPKLARFSTPAFMPDRDPGAWNTRVRALMADLLGPELPQFYDPTRTDTPKGTPAPIVSWTAFPATLRSIVPTERERWALADRDRRVQDEYCEWAVTRDAGGTITRVTFTTELPEYWEHLFATDRAKLLRLYRRYVSRASRRRTAGTTAATAGTAAPTSRTCRTARTTSSRRSTSSRAPPCCGSTRTATG